MTDNRDVTTSRTAAAGFTLVEMVIVVLILAIAAGLAAPMFGTTEATKLGEAARLISADLAYAQVESIAHADDKRFVQFDTATHTWSIRRTNAPNEAIFDVSGLRRYQTTFGAGRAGALDGVRFGALALGGDNRLRYGIYGEADEAGTTPLTIRLLCGNRSLLMTIDRTSGEPTIGNVQ